MALGLLEAGHKQVRVGIWRGDRQIGPGGTAPGDEHVFANNIAKVLEEKGAEIVDFNWADQASYDEVLSGVKSVFCTLPHMEGWAEVFPAFIKACKKSKVEHFVKISFLRNLAQAELYRKNVPFVRFHSTCDDLLEHAKSDSRISYTILCCSHLMSTPILHQGNRFLEEKTFVTASYGMGVSYVSPNDVAAASLVVLLNLKKHRNKEYNLIGPIITDSKVCKLLSDAYGYEILHKPIGYHEYVADISRRGLPEWFVKDSAEFERMKASGIDEELAEERLNHLEKVIGRPAEGFEEYLQNKDSMRPGVPLTKPMGSS